MNYVIYARVSTGLEEQKTSFDAQTTDLQKRVEILYPQLKMAGIYGDRGISGTTDERPDFQKMIEDAHLGKFELIVTKSISRFARNTRILLNTIKELEECGVAIIFLEENIDTRQATQKFLMTVLGALAEMEAENTHAHIKEAMATARASGKMAKPLVVAFGYKNVDKQIVVDKEEAEIVRQMFDWLVNEGLPVGSIVTRLLSRGIKTRTGKTTWNRQTVKYVLKNPKYAGRAKETNPETGEVFYFDYPPIVTERIFERAQEILASRKKEVLEKRPLYNNFKSGLYPLSQITKCKICGGLTTRYSNHSEYARHSCDLEENCSGHPMWGCLKIRGGKCQTYKISEQYMYECVIHAIAYLIMRTGYMKDFLRRLSKDSLTDAQYEKALALYHERKAELEQRRKTELNLFRKALISETEVEINVRKIDADLAKLKKPKVKKYDGVSKELLELVESFKPTYAEYATLDRKKMVAMLEELADKLHPLFTDLEMKRKIVRGLVEEVLIGGDPYTVEIKFLHHPKPIKVHFHKASPYKRGPHYRYEKFEIVL